MTLLGKIIRLAHSNPDLRPHLLPILKEAAKKPKTIMRFYITDSKAAGSAENNKVLDAFNTLLNKAKNAFKLRDVDVDFSVGDATFRNGHLGVDVDLSGDFEDIERAWKSKDDLIYNVSAKVKYDDLAEKVDLSPFGITESSFGFDVE